MKGLKKVVAVLAVLVSASGCGAMIGTPEYWARYNETIIRAAELRSPHARRENITEDDRAQLDELVNKRIARK